MKKPTLNFERIRVPKISRFISFIIISGIFAQVISGLQTHVLEAGSHGLRCLFESWVLWVCSPCKSLRWARQRSGPGTSRTTCCRAWFRPCLWIVSASSWKRWKTKWWTWHWIPKDAAPGSPKPICQLKTSGAGQLRCSKGCWNTACTTIEVGLGAQKKGVGVLILVAKNHPIVTIVCVGFQSLPLKQVACFMAPPNSRGCWWRSSWLSQRGQQSVCQSMSLCKHRIRCEGA